MPEYNHKKIEKKWQERWEKKQPNKVTEHDDGDEYYCLIEFPFPSGDGLHVGHLRSNTGMDVIARKRRAEGYNVLYPIGWDAFGLPTENYAIKTGIHPSIVTKTNTDNFRRQLKAMGYSFDWSREINTSDPQYYKWTQWIFLQFYKHDLAYKAKMPINWCLGCKIGLANEEVVDGKCERCGSETEKREKEQWMLAITKYADRLDKDLDTVDYLPKIKLQQRNWIGRSEGINIYYEVIGSDEKIVCFTTTPVNFGATFIAVAPEHPLLSRIVTEENRADVMAYVRQSSKKEEIERAGMKDKTGVFTGAYVHNHVTGEAMPIWVADFVLPHVGTGALQGCPGHDMRDFVFAKKYGLPIKRVVVGHEGDMSDIVSPAQVVEKGMRGCMINSGFLDGLEFGEAMQKTMDYFETKGWGERVVNYKLRDWVFSRQRYWGEPIPIIHCERCGVVPVPERDLPVVLPDIANYKPTDDGRSPLAAITEWVNVLCPACGSAAQRETDTMPNWAGSSWYYLRYADPNNTTELASKETLRYWTPVDWYNGGMEHTTLHLLYSRFWHKFLYDIGIVPTNEPYLKRTSHGLILADGGEKMSKSKGNVVNPATVVENVGADTLRVYEMFMGPFDQAIPWSTDNMVGSFRFIERIWRLFEKVEEAVPSVQTLSIVHKTIKHVSDDIEAMKFNTAISALMIFLNHLEKEEVVSQDAYAVLVRLVAPFAPHVSEELWEMLGNTTSVHAEAWPVSDPSKTKQEIVTVTIQINGKVRGHMDISPADSEGVITQKALQLPEIAQKLQNKTIKKTIYVNGRLLSIVTEP